MAQLGVFFDDLTEDEAMALPGIIRAMVSESDATATLITDPVQLRAVHGLAYLANQPAEVIADLVDRLDRSGRFKRGDRVLIELT